MSLSSLMSGYKSVEKLWMSFLMPWLRFHVVAMTGRRNDKTAEFMNESYLISMVGQTHTLETSGLLICCSMSYFANILNKISFVLFISMWSPFMT